jgi:hypothetical protein
MGNPWLNIPLVDYEGHMDSAEVQQLGVLSSLFAEAIAYQRPNSIAVLGIAGGNGLEHIDEAMTRRVAGLDVNPEYLQSVRQRHGQMSGLELHCVDLVETLVNLEPAELVHAALIFEHAGTGRCLDNALALVAPGGALSVVLQLASEKEGVVSRGRFASMQTLTEHFSLIEPLAFCKMLEVRGFHLVHETKRSLTGGKGFWMGVLTRTSGAKSKESQTRLCRMDEAKGLH